MTDRIRLLYVDDDVSSLEIRGDILEEEYGFDVTTATGVADAKRRLAEEPTDCVLSDLEMPDQDGFELLDHVRAEHGSLPFILFTGHESEEVARRAFENGATDYVPKSMINISYELLAHRIVRAVEWHRHFETEHGADPSPSDAASPAPLAPPDALDADASSPTDGFVWLGESNGGRADETDAEDAFAWLDEDAATLFGSVAAGSAEPVDADDGLPDADGSDDGLPEPTGSEDDFPDAGDPTDAGAVPEDVDFSLDPPTVTGGRDDGESRDVAAESDGGVTENGATTDGRDEDPLFALVRTAVGADADGDSAADRDGSSSDEREVPVGPTGDRPETSQAASTGDAEPGRSSRPTTDGMTARNGATDATRTVGTAGSTGGAEVTTTDPSRDRSTAADADARPTTDYDEILAEIRSSSEPITVGSDAEPEPGRRGRESLTAADRRDGSTDQAMTAAPPSSSDSSVDTAPAPTPEGSTPTEGGSTTDVDVGSLGSPVTDDPGSSPDGASGGVDGAVATSDSTASGAVDTLPPTHTAAPERSTSTASTDADPVTRTEPTDDGTTASASADGETAETAETAGTATGPAPPRSSAESTETTSATDAAPEEPSSAAGENESLDTTAPSRSDGAEDDELAWEESDSYDRPDGLDLEPGTSVLVQCGSHDEREHQACVDLLGGDRIMDKHVLLVRYKRIEPARLRQIAESAAAVKLLTVGYSQPIPDAVRDAVDTIRINNPDDLTRLGIVTTSAISDWNDDGADIHVCFHPLNVPLQYKNQQSVFRFLHIFLNKLNSADAVSHFHIDPTASGPQSVSAFKPLFDSAVNIDSVGTHLETS